MNSLVSANWLLQNIDNPNVVILDASFKGISEKDTNNNNFQIKNARFFDLKHFKDKDDIFPNTYPKPDYFEKEIQKLGIKNNQHIVIYDHNGIYSSPRVWWLFKLMGHQKVSVLNGGLPNWINNHFPIEKKNYKKEIKPSNYKVNFNPELVVDYFLVKENVKQQKYTVIDARSKERFDGTGSEPRKELPSGSIPNSINIPYQNVLENGFYKPRNELSKIFNRAFFTDKPLIFSCGSGITACILLLASEQVLDNKNAIYDGSWTEWASLINN